MNSRQSIDSPAWLLVAVWLCALPVGAAEPAQVVNTARPPPASAYRLGPGDRISVAVWKQPSLSLDVPVAPDGTINYPLAGSVDAAGLTPSELELRLTDALKGELVQPQVSVTLLEAHSYRVYVIGEVLRPGEFQLKGPATVLQTLAMASGFTPFAARSKVVIVGPPQSGRPTRGFDYERFLRDPDASENIVLLPGDTVVAQ